MPVRFAISPTTTPGPWKQYHRRTRDSGRFVKRTPDVSHTYGHRYRPPAAHDVTTEWPDHTFEESAAGSQPKLSTASGLQRVQFRIGKKRTPTRPIECTFRGQSKSGIPGLRCVQSGIVEERHTAEHAAIAESPTGRRRGGPRIGERGKRKHVAIEFVLRQI